jgi:uncharacterized protein (TIGR03000 family)
MQSLLLMTVLSGAAHVPEQYVIYPCGYTRVYYGPVAYYPAEERVYAAEILPSTRKKLDDLSAQLDRISERVAAVENHFRALEASHKDMEAKHKELAAGFDRKLEKHAQHMEKILEARLKEERVRQELASLREKTQALESGAKMLSIIRLENMHQHLVKLENHMKKLETALTSNQAPAKTTGLPGPETNYTFEASEDIGAAEVPDKRALIVVNLPEKAKLFVNGQLRKGSSRQRFILTPQLEDGDYYYTLRVDLERDGRKQSQTRQVTFRRGMQVRVRFENPSP